MPGYFRRAARAAGLIAMAAFAPLTAHAAALSLAAAVERTLAAHPALAAYAPRAAGAAAAGETAALRPPLVLEAAIEDAFGGGAASGLGAAETTLALSSVVELGAKRARRVAVATAELDYVAAERAAAELDVIAEVGRRFVAAVALREHLALAVRATALAAAAVTAAETRAAAGSAPEVELRRARIGLERARLAETETHAALDSALHLLAAMWGATTPDFDDVSADLYAVPQPEPFARLVAEVAANPDFLLLASEARLRDAELRLAQSQARADLTVSAGVRRSNASDAESFVLSFGMPLGSAARARGATAAAEARRRATDADRDALRVRSEAQLYALHRALESAASTATALGTEVLPEMEAVLEATRAAFERGRYDYLVLADAQRELVELERERIEAAANAHRQRIEIERLTGTALPVVLEGGTP
jgi:cobalt-zinc-cadmium efflux system outer membrane protein